METSSSRVALPREFPLWKPKVIGAVEDTVVGEEELQDEGVFWIYKVKFDGFYAFYNWILYPLWSWIIGPILNLPIWFVKCGLDMVMGRTATDESVVAEV